MGKNAFEGLKVLGFVQAAVGPFMIKPLSDHGATVVKIESIVRPDMSRMLSPFKDNKPGLNRSGIFALANNGILSISLNLKHPRSREVASKLIAWADVVVENYVPGVMSGWGYDYEQVKKINPNVIMISSSQQGQTGPHKELPGYGPQLQGLVGFTHLTGWADRPPAMVTRGYPDQVAARFGALALIAALEYRKRTGKGQYIDISQYEASLQWLAPVILDYTVNKRSQSRVGNQSPYAAPHAAYRCKGDDRWCIITVTTDSEWDSFCKVIGNPEWTREVRFSSFQERKKHEDELNKLIETWTVQHTDHEVMDWMQKAGVPAGFVRTAKDVVDDCPQLKHRGYFRKLKHPEMGEVTTFGPNFILSETPARLEKAAPCLGEHTEHICRELLGMSDEEFVGLLSEGVFE